MRFIFLVRPEDLRNLFVSCPNARIICLFCNMQIALCTCSYECKLPGCGKGALSFFRDITFWLWTFWCSCYFGFAFCTCLQYFVCCMLVFWAKEVKFGLITLTLLIEASIFRLLAIWQATYKLSMHYATGHAIVLAFADYRQKKTKSIC